MFLGFPSGSDGKESACNVGDLGLIPGFRRFPGERKGYPLHYSGLENSMDSIVRPWGHKELDKTERLSLSALDEDTEMSYVRLCISHFYLCIMSIRFQAPFLGTGSDSDRGR